MSAEEKLRLIERITLTKDQQLLEAIMELISVADKSNHKRKSKGEFYEEIEVSLDDSLQNKIILATDLKSKIKSWS